MTESMRIAERLAHKRPVFSFEFFPPRTEQAEQVLWNSLEELAPLAPDFVSVTFGAGGSTRTRTVELVGKIKSRLGIEAMAHLTCVGSTRDEVAAVVDRLGELGIENILALRGDPPRGETEYKPVEGGFRYANELVAYLREQGGFCIGAACYPEVHPDAESAEQDLLNLKRKVSSGVDFLITQMFFDNQSFFSFERRARETGIGVPIIPGIIPVTNRAQIKKFAELGATKIPDILSHRLEKFGDDPHEVFWTGVSYAAHQCRQLLQPEREGPFSTPLVGVPGIHFYTMNRSPATRAIFQMLRLSRAAI